VHVVYAPFVIVRLGKPKPTKNIITFQQIAVKMGYAFLRTLKLEIMVAVEGGVVS
jgi:hypothetical protein